jgi:CspA family cold shock protein
VVHAAGDQWLRRPAPSDPKVIVVDIDRASIDALGTGYGFIAPDTGGKDVFVHISAVEKAGLDGLPDGAKVTFDIVPNRGKESAENLRVK